MRRLHIIQKVPRWWAGLRAFAARSVFLVLFVSLGLVNAAFGAWKLTYNPDACRMCHIIRPYVESYYDSPHLDNVHEQAGVGCKDCHHASPTDVAGEAIAYVFGTYHNPLREARVSRQVCLECHRSYESLVERTSDLDPNPHLSHLTELECYLCHKSHQESQLYCLQCHDYELEVP